MKENKFRSWNGKEKKFYYFKNGRYYVSEKCSDISFSQIAHKKFDWNNAEQFTGLKDKTGKDIYEGDTLRTPDSWDDYGMIAGEERNVYYHEASFKLKPKREDYGDGHYLEDGIEYTIIGNIHEQKEP